MRIYISDGKVFAAFDEDIEVCKFSSPDTLQKYKEGLLEIADNEYGNAMVDIINSQPKIGEWIPCSERMPEEHDTMFAKLKGTDKWNDAMFERMSDDVNVTVEFDDGSRKTMTLHTCDGEWKTNLRIEKFKVISWQPLPEPCKGDIAL